MGTENSTMSSEFEVAIVGGGIAGYTAALTAKALLLPYVWLGSDRFGEKLKKAEHITGFPGVSGTGADFTALLTKQADAEEIAFTPAHVDGIYRSGKKFLLLSGERSFAAKSVVLATGVRLGAAVEGEGEFLGKGVSYCAVCDGALYRGKRIAALLLSEGMKGEVSYLARFASEVHCFTALPVTFSESNVAVHRETPKKIIGEGHVEALLLEGGTLEVSGVFVLSDALPPAALCAGLKTEGAHILAERDLSTSIPGVFAAGDVTGRPYRYAKAAGEGCIAVHSAREYLRREKM